MLGKTAGGIFWLFRYLERSENMARLIEAGMRIALTRLGQSANEWQSLIDTVGAKYGYEAKHSDYSAQLVVDYLLREKDNPASVRIMLENARNNGRLARTAMTREVWEAINDCHFVVGAALAKPIKMAELPKILETIRQSSALVRGALHGTMLRNDVFNFARLGTFVERADNTARIMDVKYYVLLPSVAYVGSSLDNVQWDTILRSLSAQRAYRWLNPGETVPVDIARFLVLDQRFPRSLAFCIKKTMENLTHLRDDYAMEVPSLTMAENLHYDMQKRTIEDIFENGLHEFVLDYLGQMRRLSGQIELDYRFQG